MSIIDIVRSSFSSLTSGLMRTTLTVLGIVIGVGAVILVMSVGQGMRQDVVNRISGLGSNLLFISSAPPQNQTGQASTAITVTAEDGYAINDPELFPYVEGVTSQIWFPAQIIAEGQNVSSAVNGASPEYPWVRGHSQASGRFITDMDVQQKAMVAVIGSSVAKTLFGDEDPIGQTIRANMYRVLNYNFQVVGVMEEKGYANGQDQDNFVFIPVSTLQARIPAAALRNARGETNVFMITVKLTSDKYVSQSVAEISDLLRKRHNVADDDFKITTQQDMVETRTEIADNLTYALAAIAGIALVVGGIGIMNIMLVAVTERTREIGIRKAVGAKRSAIMMQFLTEALMVTLFGGFLGIALGWGVSVIADDRTIFKWHLQTAVAWWSVGVAFGVSGIVGVVFGVYPAWSASRLNPIEALRHE